MKQIGLWHLRKTLLEFCGEIPEESLIRYAEVTLKVSK